MPAITEDAKTDNKKESDTVGLFFMQKDSVGDGIPDKNKVKIKNHSLLINSEWIKSQAKRGF